MSDNTERMLGQLDGKLDAILRWQEEHNKRHEKIDEKLDAHEADINLAKGAKAAIFVVAGFVSGAVALAASAAQHFFK